MPKLAEWHIYGNEQQGRFVTRKPETEPCYYLGGVTNDVANKNFFRILDKKEYELKNHLGNVRVAIGDMKLPANEATSTRAMPPFLSDEKAVNDYYPFGMTIADRSWQSTDYRYGYNQQEKSLEIDANGNHNTAEFWEYDTRTVRRWNLDPKPTVGISDYATFANNPIWFKDPLGDTIIVNNTGGITRNDKTDNLVFMSDNRKLTLLGELGGKINANTIYKNLLEQNAKEAKEIWNPYTFYMIVKNEGKWDYKMDMNSIFGLGNDEKTQFSFQGKEMESQDIGNHHFGVVGKAYGLFPETFMLQRAGINQMERETSRPEWQKYKVTTTYGRFGFGSTVIKVTNYEMLPPYGDDPRNQEWIKVGFQYQKNMGKK